MYKVAATYNNNNDVISPPEVPKWVTRCSNCSVIVKRTDALRGEVIYAGGRLWHKDHFYCTECKTPLPDMEYYVIGSGVVCLDCHLDDVSIKCEGCGRAVYEDYYSVDGKPFHQDCFVCALCNNPMPGGKYVILNGRWFDEDCYYTVKYRINLEKPAT